MSFGRQARIELAPSRVSYPAWWMVPISYETIPTLVAVFDGFWVVALSAMSGPAYQWISDPFSPVPASDFAQLVGVGIAVAVMFLTAAFARRLYQPSNLLRRRSQIGSAWAIWTWTFLCLVTVAFLLKIGHLFSRGAVSLLFCIGLIAIAGSRVAVASLVRRAIAAGRFSHRHVVLVVDESDPSRSNVMKPLERYGYALLRAFAISTNGDRIGGDRLVEQIADVLRYVRQRRPDEVLLAIPWQRSQLIRCIADELRSVPIPVRLLTDRDMEWLLERRRHDLGPAIAVELQGAPLGTLQRAAKRLFDIALASAGLAALFPVFVVIALAIRLDSAGPVLFQQGRTGFNGRAFRIFKFRTMTVLEDGPIIRQAGRNDRRVTRVGRLLRRFSLDELPQLINVLTGDMSIVGPRPHALAHDDQYSKLIAEYAARHKMKPGITGWAQINGCRGETPQTDMMRRRVTYDLWYIDCWSLWLDLRIIVRTAIHVLKDPNVY
jgi:putative colanic acid biosynthesis UDP-glucose lipid carrier transferase